MNRSKFYFHIIKYLCLFGAFILTNIVCACSMEKLDSIQRLLKNTKNNITEIKYNYNYLHNQKNKFLSLENDLKKCIKTQENKIRNIQKVTQGHLNYNLFKTEKIKSYNDKIVILQNYITAYLKAITNINDLIILIDEQIQDAKYFYDKQALKYSFSESIRNVRFVDFRMKNTKQIFPFIYYVIKKYNYKINLFICFLIIIGIIFSLIFRKYEKQEKDQRKKMLYTHLKWLSPIFIPIKVLKILIYFLTKDWLEQPNGYFLFKLVDLLISTDIAIIFYFYFFKQIPSFDKYKKILGIYYKIIFSFLALGIMQFFRLYVFYESGIIIQIHSILRTAIFFPFIAYQSINLTLQLTNSSLWDKPKSLYFMVYRYLSISAIIIYFLIRTAASILGYITFSTSYLFWIIVTLMYYMTFLSFQLSIQNSSNNKHLQFFNKIKALFSLNKEDTTFEFKMILLLINFLVLYIYIEYILNALNVPSYFIHQYQNFILENINIGKIKFSLLHLYEALILFSIIVLYGKYLIQKINHAPKYRENIDKMQTVTIFVHYFFYALASICALLVIGLTSTQLSFMIGSIGFGVGIGAQKILKDYFSGLVLLTKKNIHIDDYIQIGSNISMSGKIQNIGALSTQILNDEQLLIIIPNSSLIDEYIIDYTSSDLINTCFINLKIKSFKDYSFLVKKVENLLLSSPEIYHDGPEHFSIKILHSKKDLSDEFISININFTIIEPSKKHYIFHKIKNKLFLELKNEIYPI